MPFDDDWTLKCAPWHLPLRIPVDKFGLCALLFLDANEHFIEQIAFKLLPGLKIFANTDSAMEAQLSKSVLLLADGNYTPPPRVRLTFRTPSHANCQREPWGLQ
jgi:hypothetical protein